MFHLRVFSFGNVDVASNWFGVVTSIGEAVKQIVPPLSKRVFCAKRKVTFSRNVNASAHTAELQCVMRNSGRQSTRQHGRTGRATARSFSRDAKIPGQSAFLLVTFLWRCQRKVTKTARANTKHNVNASAHTAKYFSQTHTVTNVNAHATKNKIGMCNQ